MSGINTSPFKPRRGKTSTMLGDKKSTLLKEGEFFVEVPDKGVGKGHSKIKIGDGVTAYSSLPYALGDTSNDNITFTDSDTSTDVNTAVTNVASGRSLGGIIASIKNALKLLGRTATQSISGLMSSADKKKLDGIESGAQKNTVTGIKGSAESAYRTGNVNITKANIGLGNVDNTADADKTVKSAITATNATNASTATYSKNAGTATYSSKAGNASIADNSTLWGGYTNQIGTEDNTDTWIPVVTNKVLKHTTKANIISPCVQRSGDTMAGSLNFANGTQNKVGDDVSIGDINLGGSLGVMGLNGETAIFLAKRQSTWAQNVEGAFLVYDSTDKCLSFKFQ